MNENQTAVSVYSQDGMDDFPVLKAFQQYIDSEQAKARKRLVMLGVFFCILIGAVIAAFVAMLASVTARNQQLNDRLVEFAMQERASTAATMMQGPAQDNSMILALSAKLDEMQKKLDESRAKAEKDAAVAAERARITAQQAAKAKAMSAEELEIKRLKALLEIEQKKVAAEKERRRQAELETYRRRQYPELYKQQETPPAKTPRRTSRPANTEVQDVDNEIDAIVSELDGDKGDGDAISYFDGEQSATKKNQVPTARKTETKATAETSGAYTIPVDVKKTNRNRWHVPTE